MSQRSPTSLLSVDVPRALVSYLPARSTEQSRQRRQFWFGFGQSFNLLLIGAVACAVLLHLLRPDAAPEPGTPTEPAGVARSSNYVTANVVRGDLSVRVSASGTVEPTRLVEVSTELSGTIRSVHVENNDPVKSGQLLAELDSDTLVIELKRAEAQVLAARARVEEAEALTTASKKELSRKRTLAARDLAPARELENAAASDRQAHAAVDALQAELKAARANLDIAKANLGKGRIVSPIDGIVLRRNVEPGQTVAASLQSPVLFRLAQDLDRMQIRVDVDEADALSVREGQLASFTVQALRDQPLEAVVEKLYMGAEIVQGVVTYRAILSFDNRPLGLRPGMTAIADIVVKDVRGGLLVPNSALRFSPPDEAISDSMLMAGTRLMGLSVDPANANGNVATNSEQPSNPDRANRRRVWIDEGGKPRPRDVEIGATDGTFTEILKGPLKAGQRVIVDIAAPGPGGG